MTSRQDCPAPDVLAAFASGALPPHSKVPVEQHVSHCDVCLETVGYLTSKASQAESGELMHPTLAATDQVIGPYRLIRRVGEGGMGEVWEAQQTSPVCRTVAVKLLKAGMDTRQILTRFDAERQVLALMQHPSIAQVFDAGVTTAGRPYFVMEYVDGARITAYCDQARLNVHARLELFKQVCEAVQHAHQKGIIHRDLKPSNVLVIQPGEGARPKVIDFGLAKAIKSNESQPDLTQLTELGTLLGTPAYASPEQMGLGPSDVDTRTDVYSLGVLLYEMLVGVIPYDFGKSAAGGFIELRQAVRDSDPARPSVRLSRLGERASQIAKSRDTMPGILRKQVRGDLDWIVMKALEKDRERRYTSPHELSLDIDRYLNHEPVFARSPTTSYRVAKFVRRHRLGTAFAATIAAMLIAFVATTLVQARRIAQERDRATAEAAKASSINDFLQETLGSADPWQTGKDISIREVLANAVKRAETEFKDQPLIAAAVHRTIGAANVELGRYQEGEALLRSVLATRERLLGSEHVDVGQSEYDLAVLYKLQAKYTDAERYIRDALSTHRKALGDTHATVANDVLQLAMVLFYLGNYTAAAAEGEAALAMFERLHGADSAEMTSSLVSVADIVGHGLGDYARAEQLVERSYQITLKAYGKDDYRTAFSMVNLATFYTTRGKLDRTEALFREALPTLERALGKDHPEFATTLENFAGALFRLKRYDESLELMDEVLTIRRARLGDDSAKVARSMLNIATVQTFAKRLVEASDSYAAAVPRMAKAYGEDHPDVAFALYSYGKLRLDQQQLDAAEALFERALTIQQTKLPDDHPNTAFTRADLGSVHLARKDYAKAEPLLLSAYAARLKAFGPKDAKTIDTATKLVSLYAALGKSDEAAKYKLAATVQ